MMLTSSFPDRYMGKILFGTPGEGVETGIKGVTGVSTMVEGVGELALERLPVQGVFYVKKP
jgi:hypothetical protein